MMGVEMKGWGGALSRMTVSRGLARAWRMNPEEVTTWIQLLNAVFKNKLERFPDKIQSLLFLNLVLTTWDPYSYSEVELGGACLP